MGVWGVTMYDLVYFDCYFDLVYFDLGYFFYFCMLGPIFFIFAIFACLGPFFLGVC